MIQVLFKRMRGGCYIRIVGHAGTAPAGQDVVCAYVSGATDSLFHALNTAGTLQSAYQSEGLAELEASAKAWPWVRGWLHAMKELERSYPNAVQVQRIAEKCGAGGDMHPAKL